MSLEDPSSSLLLPLFQPLLAMGEAVHIEPMSLEKAILYIAGIVFFVLLNAFFVASEFAIIRVRPSQLDTEAKKHPHRVRVAQHVTDHVEAYLSANQLGITLASLALGFLGEPFVAALVGPVLVKIPHIEDEFLWGLFGDVTWLRVLSFGISLAVFTFLHVVFGELIPKNVAIRKPVGTTLLLSGPLDLFYRVFAWAIAFLNWSADLFLRKVLHIHPAKEHENVHSSEELALLVAESERAQQVTDTEREILINALELNEIAVRDIMTPRRDVVALDVKASFAENLAVARESKHTRFPLVEGNLDHPAGLIHVKDILELMGRDNPDLGQIKRDLKAVPETMALDELLQYFLANQFHVALVVDEFGSSVGLVFLDDVIEELVGEIKDEFDAEETELQRLSDDEFLVEGTMSLHDFDDHLEDLDLEQEESSTVGGYITAQLGHLPERGEQTEIDGWLATVTKADGRRVIQVHFKRVAAPTDEEAAAVAEPGQGPVAP